LTKSNRFKFALQKGKKGGFVMALFMIVCPTTGQSVPTGICINGLAWNRDAEFHAYTQCPACGLDHEWAAGDVTLSDEPAERLTAIALEGVADVGPSSAEFSL
jgi:hypothetical protein